MDVGREELDREEDEEDEEMLSEILAILEGGGSMPSDVALVERIHSQLIQTLALPSAAADKLMGEPPERKWAMIKVQVDT